MNKLHLGCGKDIRKDYVNVDLVKFPGVDVVGDLNKFPWPFKDNQFDEILSIATFEHLDNLVKVMEEVYRISKPNAIIDIRVPHFSSLGAFGDPTHKTFFTYYTFDYFTKEFEYNFYSKARFKIKERKIVYGKGLGFFQWIANNFPKVHEVFLRKILPARSIYFQLEVDKANN